MSVSVTLQLQGSVQMSVDIMLIMVMPLVWVAARDHLDVHRICKISPVPYCLGNLSPVAVLKSFVWAAQLSWPWWLRHWLASPEGISIRDLILPHLLWNSMGAQMIPSPLTSTPLPSLAVRKASHGVMRVSQPIADCSTRETWALHLFWAT